MVDSTNTVITRNHPKFIEHQLSELEEGRFSKRTCLRRREQRHTSCFILNRHVAHVDIGLFAAILQSNSLSLCVSRFLCNIFVGNKADYQEWVCFYQSDYQSLCLWFLFKKCAHLSGNVTWAFLRSITNLRGVHPVNPSFGPRSTAFAAVVTICCSTQIMTPPPPSPSTLTAHHSFQQVKVVNVTNVVHSFQEGSCDEALLYIT